MEIAVAVILLLVGMVFIIKGGDFFVDAATWMAEVSGIPKFLIGATIVSLATTLPELLVSLIAAYQGSVDLSVGNAVGSVTANLGLIMAIALICMPTAIRRKKYMVQSVMMLGAAAVLVVCGFFGSVGLVPSVILIAIFVGAMANNVVTARTAMGANGAAAVEERARPERKVVITNIVKFVVGAAGIVVGAQLLVDSGSDLARIAGVSERIIGVTIIAIGTSLPELVTTLTAIAKKQASLSIGNIIGANILDLTLILPLGALVSGQALPMSPTFAAIDMPACLLVGFVALVPALIAKKFMRWQGILLLAVYLAYVVVTSFVVVA